MLSAFQPTNSTSATQAVTATTAPSPGQQLGANIGVRIKTDAPVFFAIGKTSDVSCTVPTSAAPSGAVPMVAGTESFNLAPGSWISFATTAGSAGVYFTNGFGI